MVPVAAQQSTARPVIRLVEVSVAYGRRKVLEGISGSVRAGAVVGLIGPNGSGKSTLLKVLAGMVPYHGSVQVGEQGTSLADLSAARRAECFSYVPQQPVFGQPFSVREVVLMGCYTSMSRWTQETSALSRRVDEALQRVGVSELAQRPVTTLSGGEAQRVRLAQALAQSAQVMLLDEPTSALDLAHQLELSELLRSLQAEGKTQILALHDLNLARQLCSELWLLDKGKLRVHGSVEAVLEAQDFARVFGVELELFQNSAGETVMWPRKIDEQGEPMLP
jgi:iron complex transport system ATP-binding protein